MVALVTGGGRGIGANIARELAAGGHRVAVAGRTRASLDAIADETGAFAVELDAADPVSVEHALAAVELELGPLDLLVNNAGIQIEDAPPWEHDPDAWWHVLEVNVRGPYVACRIAGRGMAERGGGRIVNVTSGMAWMPVSADASTSYAASKAALHRFSELLALQLAPLGVAVFSLDPGLNRTDMTAGMPDDSQWTPLDRAPKLVHALASGRYDELAGRFLHAEDDLDALLERVRADDRVRSVRLVD